MKRSASFLSFATLAIWSWGCGPTDATLGGEDEADYTEQEGELVTGRPQGMFEIRGSDRGYTELERLWLKKARAGNPKHYWSENHSYQPTTGIYAFGRGAHANRLKLTSERSSQRFEYTYNLANGELTLTPLNVSGGQSFVMVNQDCQVSGCGAGFNCQDCRAVCEPPLYQTSESCNRCIPDGAVC